eukprot:scaffold521_cov137-Isochrysis_galbana.AAC.2
MTPKYSLASRAGHRQQAEGGTEHGRVRDTGGHTATPTGVLIRPARSADAPHAGITLSAGRSKRAQQHKPGS